MYTAFYGLREKPFALSPDPRFLYLAGSHREALAHLLYGIEQGEGFISITGEVGTGKTTLCRTLLERLDGDLEVAFLFNPSRTALELLQSICAEFGLPAEGLARRSLMTQLNSFLVEQKRIGRRVLLIIDEAQTLSETTLEQVRLLSNLETSREKLIQILLLGQPELDRKLDERGLRQLRQRISVRWKLDPLGPQETKAYVRHRLSIAAGEPKELFSDAALRDIHRRSGGVPRLVNQICDRALLAGYAARAAQIGPRLIRASAREIPDADLSRTGKGGSSVRASLTRPWLFFAASFGLVLVSLFAGLQVGRHGLTDSLRASVFKPAELRTDGTGGDAGRTGTDTTNEPGRAMPAVGANAPPDAERTAEGELAPVPPLVELVGYVPEDIRKDLRLTSGQISITPTEPGPARAPDAAKEDLDPANQNFVAAESSLAIPPRPAAEVTPLAPGLLGKLLAARNAQAALAETQSALLARFGRRTPVLASAPRGAEDLERSFESRGLTATPFDGGTIDLLRRLDHPVVLPLAVNESDLAARSRATLAPNAPDPTTRWVAMTGFADDRVRLAGLLPDQIVTVEIDELAAHWVETGIIVWERFESIPMILSPSAEGESVIWLQRALAELRFFEGAPSGEFDKATVQALRRFQNDRGLVSDGTAGPLTQIALYAELGRYPVPRLSESASPPSVSSPPPAASPVLAPPAAASLPPDEAPRRAAASSPAELDPTRPHTGSGERG